MNKKPLSSDLENLTGEINEDARKLGELAWKIGKTALGEKSTAKQIAKYLSTQGFGLPGGFPSALILNFMMRVNPNEIPR